MSSYQKNAQRLAKTLLSIAKRYIGAILLLTVLILIVTSRYQLALNMTQSLPQTLFLMDKKTLPSQRDHYVAFRWTQAGPLPNGVIVIKKVAGVPGDVITHASKENRLWVQINGENLAPLKTVAQNGAPLLPGPTGVIPKKSLFVYAPHPDSLDSRYALTGLIHETQIVGRAIPLF